MHHSNGYCILKTPSFGVFLTLKIGQSFYGKFVTNDQELKPCEVAKDSVKTYPTVRFSIEEMGRVELDVIVLI
jgi:hypothetical protein